MRSTLLCPSLGENLAALEAGGAHASSRTSSSRHSSGAGQTKKKKLAALDRVDVNKYAERGIHVHQRCHWGAAGVAGRIRLERAKPSHSHLQVCHSNSAVAEKRGRQLTPKTRAQLLIHRAPHHHGTRALGNGDTGEMRLRKTFRVHAA